MMKIVICALALVFAGASASWAQKSAGDPTWRYANSDEAMNAAVADARRTYPQFLSAFRADSAANQANYMVKVGLPTSGEGAPYSIEHIWVDHLHFEGGVLVGALANEPDYLPGMTRGSRIEIETARISDWSIVRSEGMYGNFTTRVMLHDVPADQAAEIRRALTRNPLPSDWES